MKKFIFFLKNYCYISGSMLLFSLVDLLFWIISLNYTGLVFWLLFALQCVYFLWWLWKNIFYQLNAFRLVNFVWDNPLSVIIGKLGTGKTLLLTYLSETMKLLTDKIYSNYPLEDDKVKVLTHCKVKMQVGFLTLINPIVYLLLKIATIFSKKNIFLNYVVISAPRKMIFVKNLKLIIKLLNILQKYLFGG